MLIRLVYNVGFIMRPRLVEISSLYAIVDMSVQNNVAAFFYGSEEVSLFGSETAMNLVVEEMIFALGYVPKQINKTVIDEMDELTIKIRRAIQLIKHETLV